MKVFISSVTYLLKDERNALPPFLGLFDHVALRFEDFLSQDRSSRDACLAGVDAADVYILLLGPRYGDRLPDSQLSPTAEEFRRARVRGIPILVFSKDTGEPDDAKQEEFKREVGHYVNGRLWKTFTDPLTLNQAVGEALRALPQLGVLQFEPLDIAIDVEWIEENDIIGRGTGPVLELHIVPVKETMMAGALALAAKSRELAIDARRSGFVSEGEPLHVGSDNRRAWVIRPSERGGGYFEKNVDPRRGLLWSGRGGTSAFVSLPTDFLGALVNQTSLQRDLAQLISLAAPHVADTVTVAAGLSKAARVREGDPAQVGTRTSGPAGMGDGLVIRVGADFSVSTQAVTTSSGDVAAELAARILNDLRALNR